MFVVLSSIWMKRLISSLLCQQGRVSLRMKDVSEDRGISDEDSLIAVTTYVAHANNANAPD